MLDAQAWLRRHRLKACRLSTRRARRTWGGPPILSRTPLGVRQAGGGRSRCRAPARAPVHSRRDDGGRVRLQSLGASLTRRGSVARRLARPRLLGSRIARPSKGRIIRAAQVRYINRQVKRHITSADPVISVDTESADVSQHRAHVAEEGASGGGECPRLASAGCGKAFTSGPMMSPAPARWSASASATIPRNSPWRASAGRRAIARQRVPTAAAATAAGSARGPRERDHHPDYGLSLSARDTQVEQD